jgi:hypothetical protein
VSSKGRPIPGVVTDTGLDYIQPPEEKRAHLVRRDSIRELGNGLFEGVTLCGKRIVGHPSSEPRPAICRHCVLAKLRSG